DILCRVNIQHNCADNSCDLSDRRATREEREITGKTVPRTHHHNPSDLLLNTNQMRSAIHLQRLRPAIFPLNQEQAIMAGALRELEEQKNTKA
ncbi:hypothetical protein EV360DRAFT_28375, partial [Lentinula raphanica]